MGGRKGRRGSDRRRRRPRTRKGGGAGHPWRTSALVLAALITIFAPAVKLVADLGSHETKRIVIEKRGCGPPPAPDKRHPW